MLDRFDGFDWDDGNLKKCLKHGVSLDEIEYVLAGKPVVAPDLGHSGAEDRFIAVGRNSLGRPMFIAYTYRLFGELVLARPISARYMHKVEAERYEKSTNL